MLLEDLQGKARQGKAGKRSDCVQVAMIFLKGNHLQGPAAPGQDWGGTRCNALACLATASSLTAAAGLLFGPMESLQSPDASADRGASSSCHGFTADQAVGVLLEAAQSGASCVTETASGNLPISTQHMLVTAALTMRSVSTACFGAPLSAAVETVLVRADGCD